MNGKYIQVTSVRNKSPYLHYQAWVIAEKSSQMIYIGVKTEAGYISKSKENRVPISLVADLITESNGSNHFIDNVDEFYTRLNNLVHSEIKVFIDYSDERNQVTREMAIIQHLNRSENILFDIYDNG